MTTQSLAKIDDAAKHDELIQLVSFDLDQEEYGVDAVSEVIRISGSEILPSPAVVTGGIDKKCGSAGSACCGNRPGD